MEGARLAREMARRLTSIAKEIETAQDPRSEIAAVQRARLGLRGLTYKPETYTRLMVMEALHRATTYATRVRRSRTMPSSSGEASAAPVRVDDGRDEAADADPREDVVNRSVRGEAYDLRGLLHFVHAQLSAVTRSDWQALSIVTGSWCQGFLLR